MGFILVLSGGKETQTSNFRRLSSLRVLWKGKRLQLRPYKMTAQPPDNQETKKKERHMEVKKIEDLKSGYEIWITENAYYSLHFAGKRINDWEFAGISEARHYAWRLSRRAAT
jgi:hypothetical protein